MDDYVNTPSTRRPQRRKKMSILAKVLIGVGVGLLVLIVAGVLVFNSFFRAATSASNSISSTDYMVVSEDGVNNKVRVNGTVQPGTVQSVTTHLTTPVNSVDVAVGDRVEAGQVVATMDVSSLQTERENQRLQLEGAVTSAQSAVNTAQSAYDQYNQGITQGTNADIVAALAAQRSANEQVQLAAADVTAKRNQLAQAQAADEDTTALVSELRAAESALRTAQGAKSDADTGVTNARTSANNQLATLAGELSTAQTALTNAQTSRDQTLANLQKDIDSAQITAPISGVVMTVTKPGAAATGPIVTIGDDSKLTITTSVRESDVSSIAAGNSVTFTSGARTDTEYTGTVTSVASIADTAQQSSGEVVASGGNTSPTFTVTIEVTGSREGLYLGSSVKADIITAAAESNLSVPIDAVYTADDGTENVIVALPADDGNFTLEAREVKTGISNEIDIEITSGDIAPGDMIITYGELYRDRIGTTVTLDAGTSYGGW